MKIKYGFWVVLLSALLLQGCDSNDGILDDDRDTRPLVPEPPRTVDPNIPRPPENAVVITTQDKQIWDTNGQPVLMRGINLQYADNPVERIKGFAPIGSVGSNVVRIQLTKNTTADELEAALNKAVENNLIAMLMFWGPEGEITCTESDAYITDAVENLWLDEWMPVLSQAQYQSHLMINIANEWGPTNIFTSSVNQSYSIYIDTYKVFIRQFRQMGFKVPLVIDAPGCGQDHNAFLGGRAQELLAADTEANLVLSVHAYSSYWNTKVKILQNMGELQRLNVPVIVGEFGGSGVLGEDAIDHNQLMEMATGDYALKLDLPWVSTADMVALSYPLPEEKDIIGLSVSFQIHVPQSYTDSAEKIGVQLVFENADGEYALSETKSAATMFPYTWNNLIYVIGEEADLMVQSANFDYTRVTRVGVRITANGKAADVTGDVFIDNFVVKGAADPIYYGRFDTGLDGWGRGDGATGVGGANPLSLSGQAMAVLPDWATGPNNIAISTGRIKTATPAINLMESFEVSFKIFVPEEYSGETGLTLQPYMSDGVSWVFAGLAYFTYAPPTYSFGEWNTVKISVPNLYDRIVSDGWAGNDSFDLTVPPNAVGLQIIGVNSAKTEAILIDDFKVSSSEAGGSGLILAYENRLANWVHDQGIGDNSALAMQGDGSLEISPPWTTNTNGQKFTIRDVGLASLPVPIDLTNPFILSFDVFIPDEYSGETSMALQPYLADSSSSWRYGGIQYISVPGSISLGQWHTVEVAVSDFENSGTFRAEGFEYTGAINGLGIEFLNVTSPKTQPIVLRNVKVELVVDAENSIMELSFDGDEEVSGFEFVSDPELSSASWVANFDETVKTKEYGIKPFGWLAWSWKGNGAEVAGLDMSLLEGFVEDGNPESGVSLTERGEEIVNGVYGIFMTSGRADETAQ